MSTYTDVLLRRVLAAEQKWELSQPTCPALQAIPRDTWKDSTYWHPKKDIVVLAWDGLDIFRCRYDEDKKKWLDQDDHRVMVYMWRRL